MHHKKEERHATHNHHAGQTHNKSIEEKLVENMIHLQKVHADLADKFTKLSNQISALLTLFEISAKNIANSSSNVSEKDKEFLNKIDKLLDQNKTIAKGLTLMDGKIRERMYGSAQPPMQTSSTLQGLPPMSRSIASEPETTGEQTDMSGEMTPSISSSMPDVPKPLPKY